MIVSATVASVDSCGDGGGGDCTAVQLPPGSDPIADLEAARTARFGKS